MIDSLNILKLLAVVLIVNSHLNHFFHDSLWSFGGGLGNSLFYFLSGYSLTTSQLKRRLPVIEWFERRFIKIIVPFVLYIAFTSIGNLDKFINQILNLLLIHKIDQLYAFFPVLWILYLIFLPLFNVRIKQLIILLTLIIIAALIGLMIQVKTIRMIPNDITTYKIFFTLNGFACFITGVLLAKGEKYLKGFERSKYLLLSILGLIICQCSKSLILKHSIDLIPITFCLNLLSILFLYFIFNRINLNKAPILRDVVYKLAKCSLAVFVIHFQIAVMLQGQELEFHFKVILLYLYSFLLAYPLSAIGEYISNIAIETIRIKKLKPIKLFK